MLYFATRMECPYCMYAFNVWFQAEAAPDADARYRVRCPMNASDFVLPFSVFKPVDRPPIGGVTASHTTDAVKRCPKILDLPTKPSVAPKPPASQKRWWQFWTRG